MEIGDQKCSSSGYGKPPWKFRGRSLLLNSNPPFYFFLHSLFFFLFFLLFDTPPFLRALYQLHLVKAGTARACIPKELRLVEAFGYCLIIMNLFNFSLIIEDTINGCFVFGMKSWNVTRLIYDLMVCFCLMYA